MTWIEHLLGVLAMAFCLSLVTVLPIIYACVVVGSRSDNIGMEGR